MADRVSVERQDGVADVRLNRPDKLNALDRAMFDALVATGRELAAERSLRAVVLSGAGRANQVEAVHAHLETRAPKFEDPS